MYGSVTQRIMWLTPADSISLIFATHSSGVPAIDSLSAISGVVISYAFSRSPVPSTSTIAFVSAGSIPCASNCSSGWAER